MVDFILLIPCLNNEKGLIDSIKSINYPPKKFKILIVDDGSSTPISEIKIIFSNYFIEILRIENNKGILNALNTGLKHVQERNLFKYIARLDAGDTCHSDRFIKQIHFLDNNSEIALLGSWGRFENATKNKKYDYITQTTHDEIVKEMHSKCSFLHPTVVFRKEIIDTVGFYPGNFPHAEDYAYFWEVLKKHKAAVLPELLVNITVNDKNISSENYRKQLISRKRIIKQYSTYGFLKAKGLFLLTWKQLTPTFLIKWMKFK